MAIGSGILQWLSEGQNPYYNQFYDYSVSNLANGENISYIFLNTNSCT